MAKWRAKRNQARNRAANLPDSRAFPHKLTAEMITTGRGTERGTFHSSPFFFPSLVLSLPVPLALSFSVAAHVRARARVYVRARIRII